MMYGQMTAGSWIYIGTQGIVQGTYETFVEAGRQHYGGNLKGKWILTGGLGGMGGAQPLAAVMAGACCLAIECNPDSIDFRLRTRYVDEKAETLDEAMEMIERWTKAGEAKSVGLLGNAAEIVPEMFRRGIRPDMVTDQTSAHDPINGYLPKGWTMAEWREKRVSDPKAVEKAARASMREHVEAMVAFWNAGVPTLDYGNNIRQVAKDEGFENAFAFPGFVPAYIRPLFCRASAHSAGPRSPAIRRISTRPTPRCANSPPATPICTTGSTWRASALPFRVCRPASAGSVSATATGWALPLTRWWPRANSRRQSSSAAITSIPAQSLRRTARRKR